MVQLVGSFRATTLLIGLHSTTTSFAISCALEALLRRQIISAATMPRPVAWTCHLCGRGFGSASLAIHVKSCEERWLREEATKLPRDRRALPTPPSVPMASPLGLSASPTVQAVAVDTYNAAATASYNATTLVPCGICGRTFASADRLSVHSRSCTPDTPARRGEVPALAVPSRHRSDVRPLLDYNIPHPTFTQSEHRCLAELVVHCPPSVGPLRGQLRP